MFGGGGRRRRDESLSATIAPENPPSSAPKGSNVTGFDPEGLERAAKAARDLDNSRNAPAAIELIKTQELSKQVRACVLQRKKRKGSSTLGK
jgi:ATPase family AAA domain-containing protein 3A/B